MDLAPGEFVHGEAPLSGSDQTRLSSHPNDEQVVAEGSTISPHFHESISENDMSKEKANQAPVDIQLDTGSDPEAAVPKDDKAAINAMLLPENEGRSIHGSTLPSQPGQGDGPTASQQETVESSAIESFSEIPMALKPAEISVPLSSEHAGPDSPHHERTQHTGLLNSKPDSSLDLGSVVDPTSVAVTAPYAETLLPFDSSNASSALELAGNGDNPHPPQIHAKNSTEYASTEGTSVLEQKADDLEEIKQSIPEPRISSKDKLQSSDEKITVHAALPVTGSEIQLNTRAEEVRTAPTEDPTEAPPQIVLLKDTSALHEQEYEIVPELPQEQVSPDSEAIKATSTDGVTPVAPTDLLRSIPSIDVEGEKDMLKERLERGLETHVDVKIPTEALQRSPSTIPLPPVTPHVADENVDPIDRSSEFPDESPPMAALEPSAIPREATPPIPDINPPVLPESQVETLPVLEIKDDLSSQEHVLDDTTAVAVGEDAPKNKGRPALAPPDEWEDDIATPIAIRHELVQSDQPSAQSSEEMSKDPVATGSQGDEARHFDQKISTENLHVSSELVDTIETLERQASASIVSIAPTTPRPLVDLDEACLEEHPDAPNVIYRREEGTGVPNQLVGIPTVGILPSGSLRPDFVDDARSENSMGSSVVPIAPNSPRFISPIPTPSLDSTGFSSLNQATRSTTEDPRPLAEAAGGSMLVANDTAVTLAPKLKDAIGTSINRYDGSLRGDPKSMPVNDKMDTSALPIVSEEDNQQQETVNTSSLPHPVRPRHTSSVSWTVHRSSGWFHSAPNKPGRPSLEIVEGEFSRPQTSKYRSISAHESGSKENRCIIM